MILVLILAILTVTSPTEVDNLNILLPQIEKPIPIFPQQLITATDGCYHWTSSLPNVVRVSPHNPKSSGCSRQALVQVDQIGAFPSSIYVSADEANSESQVKIPIRIRKVNKITIASKSRMMNIRQVQRLELFGFDAEENTFTSLEGLRFKWRLEQNSQILELVPLANAHLYLPLKTRQNIEKSGFQSDMLVVKALAPGNLRVVATCIEPGYQNLTDYITISVHERFDLQPRPIIRMAPQSNHQLRLVRPNQEEIRVPQSYYQIISCNGFSVNSSLYLTVPGVPSRCTLKVQDTRTKPPYESSVDIIVDYPNDLRIITSPLIVVGRQSPFEVQLFKDKIPLLGDNKNVAISSDFKVDNFRKTLTSDKKMTGSLSATLGSLKRQVTINAFLPVTAILPNNYLHLPVEEFFKLKLLGGTGLYDYELNNQIATISSINVLHAKQVGDIEVTIRDRNHLANNATFRLKVSELTQINSLEADKELNRDEWGNLYVIGRSPTHEVFTQCTSTSITLTVPETNLDFDKKVNHHESLRLLQYSPSKIVQEALGATSLLGGKHDQLVNLYKGYVTHNEIELSDLKHYIMNLQNYGICKVVRFKSIISLKDRLTVSLDGSTGINCKVPFRVYDHIRTTVRNDESQFLMTPSSSLQWNYAGGSYSWPDSKTNIHLNGKAVSAHPFVNCPAQEVTTPIGYTLKVTNEHTRRLLFPAEQTLSINVICKYPRKLQLKLEHGQVYDELFIEPDREVNGQVQVTDEYNQLFYNASNVVYEFRAQTGSLSSQNRVFRYKDNGINDTLTYSTEQLSTGKRFKQVSGQVSIYVVSPLKVEHPLSPTDRSKNITILTLFTPKRPYILNVFYLHSQVQVQCTHAVACERGQNYVAVKLLRLGVGHVTIRDKKVYASDTWNFEFIIVQADEVRISGNKDFAQEGERVRLTVDNYHQGQLISPYTYEPSYLQLSSNSSCKVVEQSINVFTIQCPQSGDYNIFGQNTYPRVIRSKLPFMLQVYKPIRVNLEAQYTVDEGLAMIQAKATLLVNCYRLVIVEGGPKSMNLTYNSQSSQIALKPQGLRSLQVHSASEGKFDVVISCNYKNHKIALIMVTVAAAHIQSIHLQSIQEPVVGSPFRIKPRFMVGDSDIEYSVCGFHYKWKTDNGCLKLGQSMSFGYLDAAGINVTARKAGSDVVHLQVLTKSTDKVIGKASKYIDILEDIKLNLPTYINQQTDDSPTSFIMAPSTRYSFNQHLSVSTEGTLLSVGQRRNVIESTRKLGHTTLALTRSEHRPLHLYVEVKQIMGFFIANTEGFITLEPYSTITVPIYLQDNTGRLFISPLQHLDIVAYSLRTGVIDIELTPHKDALIITSKQQGIGMVTVSIPESKLVDSLVVSVGSALSPGRYVNVLPSGTVQYSSIYSQNEWISSNTAVASIDSKTGLAMAYKTGKTIISNGDLTSILEVNTVKQIEQIGSQKYKGSSLQVTYRALWLTEEGLQELPSLRQAGPVNNNFNPICEADSRYLTTTVEYIIESGHQRFQCTVSAGQDSKLPSKITVYIYDGSKKHLASYSYNINPQFSLQKHMYTLSPSQPKTSIQINTNTPLNVTHKDGRAEWFSTHFNDNSNLQTVKIDMSSYTIPNDKTWSLVVSCEGQRQQVKFVFNSLEPKEQSFWNFNLDWPDYLIIAMAIVFGVICYVQYSNDEKMKNQ